MFAEMENYAKMQTTDRRFISNTMQGDLWSKKYHDVTKKVYPLFLFFDEFETRNALGGHAGEEKLGGVYISLACLPPHLMAKVQNIFVSTIFRSKHLKLFGNKKIFGRTIEELNALSNDRITINANGKIETVFFECVLVLGDNLGLNCICGYSEGFKAKYFCIVCSVTNERSQSMAIEDIKLIRSVKSYEKDILKDKFAETGLKQRCAFNALNKFHICENVTLHVLHDFSERVAVYTVSKVLQTLIKEKIITLEIINNRIEFSICI